MHFWIACRNSTGSTPGWSRLKANRAPADHRTAERLCEPQLRRRSVHAGKPAGRHGKAGVDHAIFRLPVWQEWLDLETCKRSTTAWPNTLSARRKMSALAVVPPWGTEECLREVDRCLNQLGFRGAQIVAHYGQIYLDDPAFRPYLNYLNSLEVPVVVHHTPPRWILTPCCRTPTSAASSGAASTVPPPSDANCSAACLTSCRTCALSTPCWAARFTPSPICWYRRSISSTMRSTVSRPAPAICARS
ncbi:hypothetical protein DMH27_04335 [Raoultella planticola]|nr:hypothetical protein [Raoultella planticola]